MALAERDRIEITDLLNLHGHLTDAGELELGRSESGPAEVLERLRRAAVDQCVEDMRGLYARDAVHEFPFAFPGVPSRLEGRDEIVNWIAAGWQANPLRYEEYRTHAVHETASPETIIVEQEAVGTSPVTGRFTLPGIIVLTVREGQIAHLRDYVNTLAAAAALGQEIGPAPERTRPLRGTSSIAAKGSVNFPGTAR